MCHDLLNPHGLSHSHRRSTVKSLRVGIASASLIALIASGSVPAVAAFESSCSQTVFDNSQSEWVEDPSTLNCYFIESLDDIEIPSSVTNLTLDPKTTGVPISGLENLAVHTNLEEITIWGRSASQEAIAGISKLPRITKVQLEFPYDTAVDASALADNTFLTNLELTNAGIRDFRWVNNLTNLRTLAVDGNLQQSGLPLAGQAFTFEPVRGIDGKPITPKNALDRYFKPLDDFGSITPTSAVPARPGQSSLVFASAAKGALSNLSTVSIAMNLGVNISDKPKFMPMEFAYRPVGGTPVAIPGDTLTPQLSPRYSHTGFQWKRNGAPIPGATSRWYTLTSADAGKIVSVTFTRNAMMSQDNEITLVPRETGTVVYDSPIPANAAKAPRATIGGSLLLSETASANLDPKFFPKAQRTFQWFIDGNPVKGATKKTFVIPPAKEHSWLSVRISVHSASGTHPVIFEAAERRISRGTFKASAPTITGVAKVGSKLTATAGTVDKKGAKASFEWKRDGKSIPGLPTGKTYTLKPADLGKKISVVQRYDHPNYYSAKLQTSKATKAVAPGSIAVAKKPVVAGKKIAGRTVKVSTGTYAPKADKITYQWQRSGKPVKGATKSTYRVTAADRGKKLTVKVSAIKNGYATRATTLTVK